MGKTWKLGIMNRAWTHITKNTITSIIIIDYTTYLVLRSCLALENRGDIEADRLDLPE